MKQTPRTLITCFAAAAAVGAVLALAGPAQAHDSCGPGGKDLDTHPHCSGGGGGGDDGGDLATNDITVRWDGAVNGTGVTPRDCVLGRKPQPNGTHTVYTCFQDPTYQVAVNLSNGTLVDTKNTSTLEDQTACTVGYAFVDAPTTQYVVAVSQGEICTDGDGCLLKVQNVFSAPTIVGQTGYGHVKIVGQGEVAQSRNLNPFSCADGAGAYSNPHG